VFPYQNIEQLICLLWATWFIDSMKQSIKVHTILTYPLTAM